VALKADRLSCHRFFANQFRLLLHAAAYWLLDELRRRLVLGGIGRMQLDTLRLFLIKIGGRVGAPDAHQGTTSPGLGAPRSTPVASARADDRSRS
jgi:hypothetical protein